MDEDLKRIVKNWAPPPPGPDFDPSMLRRFHASRPLWTRFLHARVEVPVPILAVSFLALLLAALFAWPRRAPEAPGWQPVAEPRLRVIKAEVNR